MRFNDCIFIQQPRQLSVGTREQMVVDIELGCVLKLPGTKIVGGNQRRMTLVAVVRPAGSRRDSNPVGSQWTDRPGKQLKRVPSADPG